MVLRRSCPCKCPAHAAVPRAPLRPRRQSRCLRPARKDWFPPKDRPRCQLRDTTPPFLRRRRIRRRLLRRYRALAPRRARLRRSRSGRASGLSPSLRALLRPPPDRSILDRLVPSCAPRRLPPLQSRAKNRATVRGPSSTLAPLFVSYAAKHCRLQELPTQVVRD